MVLQTEGKKEVSNLIKKELSLTFDIIGIFQAKFNDGNERERKATAEKKWILFFNEQTKIR